MNAPGRLCRVGSRAAAASLLAIAISCGGHRNSAPFEEPAQADGPQIEQLNIALPSPGGLDPGKLGTYSLEGILRDGAQFEALLPSGNVTVNGGSLDFAAQGSGLSSMAFAIYAFRLEDYDRDPTLHYSFAAPPADPGSVYLGISDWTTGAWAWFGAEASGALVFPDLADYTGVAPDYLCYVAVACTGAEALTLDSIQFGTNLPADTLYAVPSQTTADPGQTVRIGVFATGTLSPFHSLGGVRVIVPQYNSYVPDSFNAGAPGGERESPDGIWTSVGPALLTGSSEAEIVATDLGDGTLAYDFYLTASGGSNAMDATGELFNFELAVYTDVAIGLQRLDGGGARTFYTNAAGKEQYWSSDDNAGGLGIALSGNAPPLAALRADRRAGPLDLAVNFDASASADVIPGGIVQYEFDFGDGGGFADNGASPLAAHTYEASGVFEAQVRVTDNLGAQGTASLTIYAGWFDEFEDAVADDPDLGKQFNDDRNFSQEITLPVIGFKGSIGPNGVYDGDEQDWFAAEILPNTTIACQLDLENPDPSVRIELQNNNRVHLAWSAPDGVGGQKLSHFVDGAVLQPLRIIVRSATASSNYLLTAQVNPPVAQLSADPPNGPLPLDVLLDAGASTDAGGSIVKYEFDFGDGEWVDNGATPTLAHQYSSQSLITARVRVTDNEGNFSIGYAFVAPGYVYDEVENNDTRQTGNQLSAPVAAFLGNIGSTLANPGYDGDNTDWFSFDVADGDAVQVDCSYDFATANALIELYDKDGGFLTRSPADNKSPQSVVWNATAAQSPLKLIVVSTSGGSDYSLRLVLNPPGAVLQADMTAGPAPLEVGFDASGSTDKAPGMIVKYEFDFSEGAGWEDYGATAAAMHTFNADGTYIVRLRVTDDDGLSSVAQQTIKVGNPYNEAEDNDSFLQANLIAWPLFNWAGSVGTDGGSYPGYDGDDADYVRFDASAGQSLSFTLTGDSETADIDIHLQNSSGDILMEGITAEAVETIEYTFTQSGTYYIWIELWSDMDPKVGYSDYICSGSLN